MNKKTVDVDITQKTAAQDGGAVVVRGWSDSSLPKPV
jgi:hypothetical protein